MKWLLALFVVIGYVVCEEQGAKLKLRFPSARQIAKGAKLSNWRKNEAGTAITPVFNPQVILSMGTPQQTFLGCGLDVSSGDTWIVDINAPQPDPAPWLFDPSQSLTFKNSSYYYATDVLDVDGLGARLTGFIAQEYFHVQNKRFSLNYAQIESVTAYGDFAEIPDVFATGRCGFGFYSSDYIQNFFSTMLAAINATEQSATVVIHDCMLDQDMEEVLQEMTIGYIDDQYCNTSTTVVLPLVDQNNWNFAITGYKIGNISSNAKTVAKLETNDLLTGVPQNVYDYLFQTTNAVNDPTAAYPVVDCNQDFPKLHFNVSGDSFSVQSHYYIFKDFADLNEPCYLMLYPLNGGGFLPSWSFGYIWMYKKCVTLDRGNLAIRFTDYNSDFCQEI